MDDKIEVFRILKDLVRFDSMMILFSLRNK